MLGDSKWYREPTRDDHSDKVYIKLKVFIPASRDYTGVKDPMQYLELGVFKGRNHIMASPLAANREVLHKQAISQKLSLLGHFDLGFLE